ncbi:MAG: hypothetical protein V8R91_04505 [Butyricimonas faecihominis]
MDSIVRTGLSVVMLSKMQLFLIMALIFVLLDFMVLGRKNKNFFEDQYIWK